MTSKVNFGVLLALIPIAPARPTADAQVLGRGDLPGTCYDLSLGPWRPTQLLSEDSIYIAPPSRVRFDTSRTERWPGRLVLVTAPGGVPSVHRYASWRPLGSDSVELIWSTGYSGLRMTLGRQQGDLRGEARTFWDFDRTPSTADAVARRVPCDPPARPIAQRPVFRAVPLEGGDSVAVGATLTSTTAQADSLRGRSFRMRRAPAGPFAGATAVEVSVNARDTIWRVEINYPVNTELESLVARLSSLLGTPVSRDTFRLRPSNEVASVGASWSNRTTRLTLRRDKMMNGEWRVSATLADHRLRP